MLWLHILAVVTVVSCTSNILQHDIGNYGRGAVFCGGPKGHLGIRILHSGSKAQSKGDPEIVVGRIFVSVWSSGPRFGFLVVVPGSANLC